MNLQSQPRIKIIPYRDEFLEAFKMINYEWIEKYFEVTTLDRKAFNNPKREIKDKGGYIYLAEFQNEIVGAVALERISQNKYALTRMGVKMQFQGKRIGQSLIAHVINESKNLNAQSIVLYTNHQLVNALNLYFKNGFKVVPLDYVPYERATIKMQLVL